MVEAGVVLSSRYRNVDGEDVHLATVTGLTAAASDRSGLRIIADAAIEARTKSRRVRLLMAILDPLNC